MLFGHRYSRDSICFLKNWHCRCKRRYVTYRLNCPVYDVNIDQLSLKTEYWHQILLWPWRRRSGCLYKAICWCVHDLLPAWLYDCLLNLHRKLTRPSYLLRDLIRILRAQTSLHNVCHNRPDPYLLAQRHEVSQLRILSRQLFPHIFL